MTVAYQNFKRETAPTKSNPPFCSLLGTRYSCTQVKKKKKRCLLLNLEEITAQGSITLVLRWLQTNQIQISNLLNHPSDLGIHKRSAVTSQEGEKHGLIYGGFLGKFRQAHMDMLLGREGFKNCVKIKQKAHKAWVQSALSIYVIIMANPTSPQVQHFYIGEKKKKSILPMKVIG